MTAPEPHNPPPSRRAAREQRERDAQRAAEAEVSSEIGLMADPIADLAPRDALPRTMPLPVIDLPSDAASPGGLPPVGPEPALPPPPTRSRRRRTTAPTPTRVGASRPAAAPTRRAARTAELMDPRDAPPRHARARRVARVSVVAGLAVVASLVMGSAATVTAAVTGQPLFGVADGSAAEVSDPVAEPAPAARLSVPLPEKAEAIPVPTVEATPAALELCAMPDVAAALVAGDDAAAIAAAGGAEAFRAAVASGTAPCVALGDPARVWVVINKVRPNTPLDYRPAELAMPEGVRSIEGGALRADAAAALSAMVGAAAAAGVGEIALESGFRSYTTQETSYGNQVNARGVDLADLSSARPGFSEHQSGLAGDVVACGETCGTLDDLAATPQGQWVAAHAWEHGWITRYEDGYTPTTGYSPEPWHLRYIGPDLARAYHEGGWHTLEEFFGLPPAPTYVP